MSFAEIAVVFILGGLATVFGVAIILENKDLSEKLQRAKQRLTAAKVLCEERMNHCDDNSAEYLLARAIWLIVDDTKVKTNENKGD